MAALVQTLAVAEHLSFHRAALALGISQSSVSARIKALEEDLGVVLFYRNTRGVRLTEAGRRFVKQVGDAIGILDRAINAARMQARGEVGELRIGVHAITHGCFLNRLLRKFQTVNLGVGLNIIEGTARDTQIMVREDKLDIAFMAGSHEIPDLNSRVIWRDQLMAALPPRHSLAGRSEIGWRQLSKETFLVRHAGTGPQVQDLIVARSAGKWQTPAIRRIDVERSTLLLLIAAGHGVSLLTEESTRASTVNVAYIPITDEPGTIAFSAVWSPRNRDPVLKQFLTLAMKMGCLLAKPSSQ